MGLKKLVFELTSLCNLSCEYCFKEAGTTHLDIALLKRILLEAQTWGASKVTYTGGEASLYPQLDEAFRVAEALGYRYALVTNGWHFRRTLPLLNSTRRALNHIFFSLDSATDTLHDQVRGTGSFQKIINAADLCQTHGLPFSFLVVLNQKNSGEMEQLSLLAAQLGAVGIRFGHLLPTSELQDRQLSLSGEKRRAAEAEAQKLNSTAGIAVSFSASASNNVPGACCEAFAGQTVSIDCHGRLSLCCQLADYRGATSQKDIVADLNTIDFANAYAKFLGLALAQRNRRDKALAMGIALAEHPCDFCIGTMEKTAWRNGLFSKDMKAQL
jgi:MoaA/NifB/PqqE/SkfB family radical SAM enzyme